MEEKEIMAAEDDQATTAVETNQATTVEVEEEEAAKETVLVDSLAVAVARSQEVALEDWVEV